MLSYRGLPFPPVQAGSSHPRARWWFALPGRLSVGPKSVALKQRERDWHPHQLLPPPTSRWSPGLPPTDIQPARSARRDDRRHKNNNKSIREGNGKGSTRGRTTKKRGTGEGERGSSVRISLSLSLSLRLLPSSHSALFPSRSSLVPLSGYCIENVMLKYACTRVGPMVRNLASSFCGSTYPDVFLCTPSVPREGESACTLLSRTAGTA